MHPDASGGTGQPGGHGDQLGADGGGGRLGVERRGQDTSGAGAARVRLKAIAASTVQAPLAEKDPEGMCANGPPFTSAMTCSTIAWSRRSSTVHSGTAGTCAAR